MNLFLSSAAWDTVLEAYDNGDMPLVAPTFSSTVYTVLIMSMHT